MDNLLVVSCTGYTAVLMMQYPAVTHCDEGILSYKGHIVGGKSSYNDISLEY